MHHQMAAVCGAFTVGQATAVVLVHTGAMIAMTGLIAILVYEWIGLAILRSAWINLDTIWAGALVAAGVLSLAICVRPLFLGAAAWQHRRV